MADSEKAARMKAMFANSPDYKYEELVAEFNEQLPEVKKQDLSGKVVLVTGANVGIGYETAKSIAGMNPKKLILACRSVERGNVAATTIKNETTAKDVEVWQLDLGSFDNVKAFAKKFNDSGLPLDILVSNAGVAFQADTEWQVNENGHETTIQVNHLANALFVLLLTPALKKSTSARINVVTSGAHYFAFAPTEKDAHPVQAVLQKPEAGVPPRQYSASKLLNVLFVNEYARRCPYKVWICSSNPGYTDSQLGTKNSSGEKSNERSKDPLGLPMRATHEGAKSIIYASTDTELLKQQNGPYITNMRVRPARIASQKQEFMKSTWDDTMGILKKFVDHNSIEEWAWAQ